MKVVTICLPESYVEGLDNLIGQSKYPNRSEVIRIAIRDLLVEELWGDRTQSRSIPLVAQLQELAAAPESSPPETPP
ncbi:MAG: ribbon-helix-helix domain-containing protein [Candidatus Thorarchaeota archaeon]